MSGIIAENSGRHTGLVKAGGAGGVWNLILTQTASASATIDFTSGINSTYDEYVFQFINIHAETDGAKFQFQGDTGTNTSYNQSITSTNWRSYHSESGSYSGAGYIAGGDQANGTAFQILTEDAQGADADQTLSGTLKIFAPASGTYVKHFLADSITCKNSGGQIYIIDAHVAGYFNLTTALTRFQFKMDTGDIDAGTISLYGIS
jgi:hypothetical protein